MEQKLMITSLPQAFKMVKEMNLSTEWDSDYREAGRRALQEIFEGHMRDRIDRHLEEIARRGEADRRNGAFPRHLLTKLGDNRKEVLSIWRWFERRRSVMVGHWRTIWFSTAYSVSWSTMVWLIPRREAHVGEGGSKNG
jgi:hypothetical protein